MMIQAPDPKRTACNLMLNSRSGFALVTVLLMVSLMAVIGITLNRTSGLQYTISYNLKEADEAYYIANAGIQQGVFTLKYNPGFRGTVADTPFSTGSYSFTIADIVSPMGDVLISSTGTSGTATRTVEKRLSTSGTFIVYPPLIKDTFVTDKNENKNFGISDHLKIGCKTEPERGLFEYDLSMIPAGATIKTAVFELYKFFGERKGGGSQISVNIHWMKRSWNEGIHDNANCTIGATWITSDCVTAWPIEGGDYDSTSQASTTIYYSEPPQWYQWNVKNLIKNWHNLSITNFGMILKDDLELSGDPKYVAHFYSKDYSDPAFRPRLTVTYNTP